MMLHRCAGMRTHMCTPKQRRELRAGSLWCKGVRLEEVLDLTGHCLNTEFHFIKHGSIMLLPCTYVFKTSFPVHDISELRITCVEKL